MTKARPAVPVKRKRKFPPQTLGLDEAAYCDPSGRSSRRVLPQRACARLCILRLKACASAADEHLHARLKRDENMYRQQQKARLLPRSKEAWVVAYQKVVTSITSGEGARIVLRKPESRPAKPIRPKPVSDSVRRRSIHEFLPGQWRLRIVFAPPRHSGVEEASRGQDSASVRHKTKGESAQRSTGSDKAPPGQMLSRGNHSSNQNTPKAFHRWYWCPSFAEADMLFSRALDYLRGYVGVEGYPWRTEAQVAHQVIAVLRYTYRFTLTYDHRLELICERLSWETLKREAGRNALPPRVEAVAIGAPPMDILVEAEKQRARLKAASRTKHFRRQLRPWLKGPLPVNGDSECSVQPRAAVQVSCGGKRASADAFLPNACRARQANPANDEVPNDRGLIAGRVGDTYGHQGTPSPRPALAKNVKRDARSGYVSTRLAVSGQPVQQREFDANARKKRHCGETMDMQKAETAVGAHRRPSKHACGRESMERDKQATTSSAHSDTGKMQRHGSESKTVDGDLVAFHHGCKSQDIKADTEITQKISADGHEHAAPGEPVQNGSLLDSQTPSWVPVTVLVPGAAVSSAAQNSPFHFSGILVPIVFKHGPVAT
ncbi:conserved hypothetical protein [Neospora caninum Liverpool]|uniref:Uncharacterized protein n=1 Tax=Neospora caninum (strain Liverpool) TaxID=572307 RepID=F0V8K9_NEOCL|nr:conserved hypothetical protein [Neospora caninum Liverpool]CBZ50050.1 conserved hypothetical protein [Neospora caninum Liverpool]CEL64643.1 TPA: hypothetical protein BN1204_005260 [Neospora caninum Liverpool]|eukprot:XP_003880085.1 conserved hypothetical protein [Neospora caninum Liverpool]